MLPRTFATHASSEFFPCKPTGADDPDLWQHAPPIECSDQDEGYFDFIMRVGRHRHDCELVRLMRCRNFLMHSEPMTAIREPASPYDLWFSRLPAQANCEVRSGRNSKISKEMSRCGAYLPSG